jgi:Flp pilus assembly protein TadD
MKARTPLLALSLAALTAIVYARVARFGFVNLDDPEYVYRNAHVLGGVAWNGVAWAFTAVHAANWHPLTWLSHMLDVELFGPAPGPHHVTSVVLHAANALLLFGVLRTATGHEWRSALVAAVFAVHPLHVESVAWISERKDVLSTAFWLLTTWAYVAWVRQPSRGRYFAIVAAFAAGLLCKPMLVTLPLTLLLLDLWPLRRFAAGEGAPASRIALLLREKLPLFALVAASCVVTVVAQSRGGALASRVAIPLAVRLENASLSCVLYLAKTAWPAGLSAVVPHPGLAPDGISGWAVAGSALLLGVTSAVAVRQWRRRPWITVGWLWYVVTLFPVIGIVQVGTQGMADRYTYVPMIGILLAVTWSVAELAEGSRRRRAAVAVASGAVVLLLAGVAWRQTGYWKDSFALFERALEISRDNYHANVDLGVAWGERGDPAKAARYFQAAIAVSPTAEAHDDLGMAYAGMGRHADAAAEFVLATRRNPRAVPPWRHLASALVSLGWRAEAEAALETALRLDPRDADALNDLGVLEAEAGQYAAAAERLEAAARVRPDDPQIAGNLAHLRRLLLR